MLLFLSSVVTEHVLDRNFSLPRLTKEERGCETKQKRGNHLNKQG